jgi:putative tryptophan/tyrosine transport system substrate-binding protein
VTSSVVGSSRPSWRPLQTEGAKPADLPIEQATEFDFVINLSTAKTLGIPIPTSVLTRADEVIE